MELYKSVWVLFGRLLFARGIIRLKEQMLFFICGDGARLYVKRGGIAMDDSKVPDEFEARTLDGKQITGEQREKMYRLFDSTIDAFLEAADDDDDG